MIKRMKEITEVLGRKPKDMSEYRKIWKILFGDTMEKTKQEMKKQRKKHLNHGFNNPNRNRGYCIFCVKENRI